MCRFKLNDFLFIKTLLSGWLDFMPLFGKLDVGMFVCMPVIKLYLDFRKQFSLKFSFLLGQYG